MRKLLTFGGLLLTGALSASCGSVVRDGRGPVFLVIDLLQGTRGSADSGTPSGTLLSDVQTLVTSPDPCSAQTPCATVFDDMGQVTLHLAQKDVTSPAGPTSNNQVTITGYRVTFHRADGRNTPGIDVPYGFDGGVTGTVPTNGTVSLGFELVRHMQKKESPLVQLITSPTIITTIADVTFYGRDLVGNQVSATGSISVNFGNFGDF